MMRSSRVGRAVSDGGVGFTLPHSDPPHAAATMARDATSMGTEKLLRVSFRISQVCPDSRLFTLHTDLVASSSWTAQT